jgi:hypothetical protein
MVYRIRSAKTFPVRRRKSADRLEAIERLLTNPQ